MSRSALRASAPVLAVALVTLLGSAHLLRRGGAPCWGDLEPVASPPASEVVAKRPATVVGAPIRSDAFALGELELRYEAVYHRFGDTDPIGWSDVRIVDPTACSDRAIGLDARLDGAPVDRTIALARAADGTYVVRDQRGVLAAFRKHAAPSVRTASLRDEPAAYAFDGAAAVTIVVAIVSALRGKASGALLGISILLSLFGALFALSS